MKQRFLYFVPTDRPTLPRRELVAIGLGHVIEAGDPTTAGVTSGPDGKGGLIFAGGEGASARYLPAVQTWHPGPGYFVGVITAEPLPGPEDLIRKKPSRGELVRLGDDREWQIPIVRSAFGAGSLEKRIILNPDCKTWKLGPLPEHAKVYELIDKVYAQLSDPAAPSMTYADAIAATIEVLQLNYRIGPIEASILQLLRTDAIATLLQVATGWLELLRTVGENAATMSVEPTPTNPMSAGVPVPAGAAGL